jgi:hypothetical protein
LTLFNLTVLGEETSNIIFGKTWVNASNKEVSARILGAIRRARTTAFTTTLGRGGGSIHRATIIRARLRRNRSLAATAPRGGASHAVPSWGRILATSTRRHRAFITTVVTSIFIVITVIFIFIVHRH